MPFLNKNKDFFYLHRRRLYVKFGLKKHQVNPFRFYMGATILFVYLAIHNAYKEVWGKACAFVPIRSLLRIRDTLFVPLPIRLPFLLFCRGALIKHSIIPPISLKSEARPYYEKLLGSRWVYDSATCLSLPILWLRLIRGTISLLIATLPPSKIWSRKRSNTLYYVKLK